jgi:transposase
MQTIYQSIVDAFPKDKTVIGIGIPLIGIECKHYGVINPIEEIKEAAARAYDFFLNAYWRPIMKAITQLLKILKINFKLPIPHLKLTLDDLFSTKLFDKIKAQLLQLYKTAKAKVDAIFKFFGIPDPLFKEILDPEKELMYKIKAIMTALPGLLQSKLKALILTLDRALAKIGGKIFKPLYDIWKKAVSVLFTFLFNTPAKIDELKKLIEDFAKKLLKKAQVTYEDLMKALDKFKIPGIGRPHDWKLPYNPKVNMPNIDFIKLITDIQLWLSNYLMNIILRFIKAIARVLKYFKIPFVLPFNLSLKATLCVI